MKIRVDNLATNATEEELCMLFECFGRVASVSINQRQRWGQVDMPSKTAAKEAIDGLNGQNLKGFDLTITEISDHPPSRRNQKPRRHRRR